MDSIIRLSPDQLVALVQEAGLRTGELLQDLKDEQLIVRRCETVNPFLWEIGHVAFFYELFLLRELDGVEPLIEGCDDLFDSFTVDHDDRWGLPLPCRERSLEYAEVVRKMVCDRLADRSKDGSETYHYLLATRHEDMHAEAFTFMRQTLEYAQPKLSVPRAPAASGGSLPGDVDFAGGRLQLGARPESGFVFDNEKWAHAVDVKPFSMARAAVTNAEFAEFISAGGYRRQELWSRQGWQWRVREGAQHPIYWRKGEHGWLRQHFDTFVSLEENHPACNLTWYEADAFCRWAERRLPTEAEWEMAATHSRDASEPKSTFPWGEGPAGAERVNMDWANMGCVDVGAYAPGDTADGVRQMIGNVWEWTASDFYPFPGYVVDQPYKQYSAPWFGYRKVLRGGCWATRSRLISATYRNFFPPERNDVFAGFRTCAL